MEDHKLLRSLVLMGASLLGCEDHEKVERLDKSDRDASPPEDASIDALPQVDAAGVVEAGVVGDPKGKLCWCPDETCSDGDFAHQGFCCCWGGFPGCSP